jgi:hypothetical protein
MSAISEKIRKTLALANDSGATEQERETALRMAHAMLAKHNLTLAEVEHAGEERRGVNTVTMYGPPWARIVAMGIAKLCFCEYVTQPGRGSTVHYFIGLESNSTTAAELSRFVIESIRRESLRYGRGSRSFASGAGHRVHRRCEEIITAAKRQEPATPGTALVLANVYASEHTKNRAIIAAKWSGRLRNGSNRSRISDAGAYDAGRAYGDRVSLNRQMGGQRQRLLT